MFKINDLMATRHIVAKLRRAVANNKCIVIDFCDEWRDHRTDLTVYYNTGRVSEFHAYGQRIYWERKGKPVISISKMLFGSTMIDIKLGDFTHSFCNYHVNTIGVYDLSELPAKYQLTNTIVDEHNV